MIDETGAAAPVTEQAQTTQAPIEQATPDTSVQRDAATEKAETTTVDEGQEDRPRKQSTSERYRRKISAQAGVIERMAAELDALKQRGADGAKSDAPKASDYPQGEWDPGYVADLAAHRTAVKFSETLAERDKRRAAERAASTRQEMVEDFEDRADAFKALTPDFDSKVGDLLKALPSGLANHVTEELLESEVGPALLYQLASDPRKAAEINAMSPIEVAREIGRLEGKTSLPKPRTTTTAPPPLNTLSGGASLTKNNPADMSMDEYVAWRKAGGGSRKP